MFDHLKKGELFPVEFEGYTLYLTYEEIWRGYYRGMEIKETTLSSEPLNDA
jgi:hypothetical protein